ncbi:hypothetical protein BCON_0395g00030 [Botryotinia convoluta]|uniref:Uncharacterized protein n=1 Tax=Botryotinia convoluta TaxID=54673 RepID=A0A4Z1H8H2_9HELO|nr:hypothetical protein BCON_0395g00030 [Botryotinia convoluta]
MRTSFFGTPLIPLTPSSSSDFIDATESFARDASDPTGDSDDLHKALPNRADIFSTKTTKL